MDLKTLMIIEMTYLIVCVMVAILFLRGHIVITNPDEKYQEFYDKHRYLFQFVLSMLWPALLILIVITYLKGGHNEEEK